MTLMRVIRMWFERASRPTSGVALALTFAGVLGLVDVAGAQTADEASRLFDHGIAELKLGKYESACVALEQSHRIDPNLGALIALADCLERWGRLHSASLRYEEFLAAASDAKARDGTYRARQRAYAESALARVAAGVPKLALTVLASSDSEVRVVLDGRPLTLRPPESENGATPGADDSQGTGAAALRAHEHEVAVDPGHHVIETHAAGHEPWRLELDVQVGQRRAVELALGPAVEASQSAAIAPRPAQANPPEPSVPLPPRSDASEPATSPWRTIGWGLGGLGVTGIGVGAVAGVMVLQTCPGFDCDSRPQRGKDLALVADIGFGVGLAALAASAILLLSTDAPPPRTDNAGWRPQGTFDARGGWLGVSHVF
jgi:hypothetical protein